MKTVQASGLKAAFGCTPEALALFRIVLGALLLTELLLRFRFLHPFYSDEGTLPLRLLLPQIDDICKAVCVHCLSGDIRYEQLLLSIQCICAASLMVGYRTRVMAIVSWSLYLSLTLRNTWLNFILDRYFHYLLFYAMFLPLDQCWAVSRSKSTSEGQIVVSVATVALKLQVAWIYFDAGWGKYTDPLGGWTYGADPLPALDTYARHTLPAQYLYAILGPQGLRLLTPTVVYVELLAAPAALIGSFFGWTNVVNVAVFLAWGLHIGIALSVRNTVLLSLVACAPWCAFLPIHQDSESSTQRSSSPAKSKLLGTLLSTVIILSFIGGSIWFETMSEQCNQSMKHIWSTLLHNRWNVFVGAEEYVTWEIAPGRLENGLIVDVWGRKDEVNWHMPGSGAPCTSTSRPGRWRSYPYLAELEGEDGYVLWNYLCEEWDKENDADNNPGRRLVEFNFFMLQADVLPNMAFSPTRKRLVMSFECGRGIKNESPVDNGRNKAENDSKDEL